MIFTDREDAGRRLADRLRSYRGRNVVVLGLPRGGVPVAHEVARALGAPLDVIVVRKLGVPFQPELGMGAIGEGGVRILDEQIVRDAGVRPDEIEAVEDRERIELERRVTRYRGGRPPHPLRDRIAIVVDDGIATGSTARAACRVARALGASKVVLAVPVGPRETHAALAADADEVVLLHAPAAFGSIGRFYQDFSQITDEQVETLLRRASPAPTATPAAGSDAEVEIAVDGVRLGGILSLPVSARGVIVFAHGSGSSRSSPRNRYVASVLQKARLGTLLFDLLTDEEERDRANVFDLELLSRRLIGATRWLRNVPAARELPVGYFGASTGAAAAIIAACDPDSRAAAIVSRGGRPDLASSHLGLVRAPTLLIVGGWDTDVLQLNRAARLQLRCESSLEVVPGATHLFEESGTLERAAELARDWFLLHLGAGSMTLG